MQGTLEAAPLTGPLPLPAPLLLHRLSPLPPAPAHTPGGRGQPCHGPRGGRHSVAWRIVSPYVTHLGFFASQLFAQDAFSE